MQILNSGLKGPGNIVVTGEYGIGDIRHNRTDISALTDDLGYDPMFGLQTGLDRIAD